MSDIFTLEKFQPHLNESFEIVFEGAAPVTIELIEATAVGAPPPPNNGVTDRQAFSLVFRIPGMLDEHYPQQQFTLKHGTLGTMELFLVPLGPDQQGMKYEAMFT